MKAIHPECPFSFFFSENKFYLNKGLNTLHNIKTKVKKKSVCYFIWHWAAVASKLQTL